MSDGRPDARRPGGRVLDELLADVPGYLRLGARPRAQRLRPPADPGPLLPLVIQSLTGARQGSSAFLDAMGIDLLPPQAARAPIVFELTPETPVDSAAPQNSRSRHRRRPPLPSSITAPLPRRRPLPPDPIVFATTKRSRWPAPR